MAIIPVDKYGTVNTRDYMLTPSDPKYRKPKTITPMRSIKVLTNAKERSIIRRVKNHKRKDKKMGTNKTNKLNKTEAVKSLMWLIEAAFRGFVGWVLLTNFDHKVTTAVAIYSLLTAGLIVVVHFFKAQQR